MEEIAQVFCNVTSELRTNSVFIRLYEFLKNHPIIPADSIFLIDRPIMESNEYQYDYDNGFLLLIKNYKVMFFTVDTLDNENFITFQEDFLEDTGALARKYDYVSLIGRSRDWKSKGIISSICLDENTDFEQFLQENKLDEINSRVSNLIISLLTGSINHVSELDKELFLQKQTLLQSIKNRIMLFDTNQTKFVYTEDSDSPIIRIQGLAGSGKTELLLHKLKKLYVEDKGSRIAFTCFNKVLADKLRGRVPEFFNYMKVDEQINYQRLFIASSWGSGRYPEAGLYSKICANYGLNFQPFSRTKDKSEIWQDAISELKSLGDFEPMFDYILIDESQDFEKEYIEMCLMVAAKKLYVAGDILQDIFSINTEIEADFLLNKVYRTDPRTVLFSHILGFGLYEKRAVRWLSEDEWSKSGYHIETKTDDVYEISRAPLQRFGGELDEASYRSVVVKEETNYINGIIDTVRELRSQYEGIQPSDIAIIYMNYDKEVSLQAEEVSLLLYKEFKWQSVIAPHEKRVNGDDEVLITNVNNVKGLEFSFVVIVNNHQIAEIKDFNMEQEVRHRNALYMTLTRSFISSTLIISERDANREYIEHIKDLSNDLYEYGPKTIIHKPDSIVDENELYHVTHQEVKSQYDLIEECFVERSIVGKIREDMLPVLMAFPAIKEGTTDKQEILKFITQLESIFGNQK
ncbi:TPA: DEAD/DEAH box helicase [Streptococcus suis]|uniref:DEAD/DEAH box helicase n=2 Tax=Streptococcus suis TaxID=1307 RepID=UPI000CF5B299|nr:DEAD/DEAH box helicase [Streptococcus suis]HEM2780823.1 DEAD/DEAH box helicase [Streptococcus suis]HEM6305587.1 DEAD/DEAH box helicase [Streptococcus suis]HEM6432294.1 DEAD/DEAH box helicase [Streptococcus suis]